MGLSDRTDGATDKAGRVKKLVERHGKFVDLFNANIDLPLAQRSSKRRVIDELNDWERNQEIKSGKRNGGLSRSERDILEEEKEVERAKETSSKTWAVSSKMPFRLRSPGSNRELVLSAKFLLRPLLPFPFLLSSENKKDPSLL